MGTVEAETRQHGVVGGALDQVGEAALAGREQQPPREHDTADRGAGLGVCAVRRQLERVTECLVAVARPERTGEIGAGTDHGLPAGDRRIKELPVARLDGKVDNPAAEVDLADGVADRGARGSDRLMVLPVSAAEPVRPEEAMPAPLDERAGQLQVALPARRAIQLHEGHLDLGVPVDQLAAIRSELRPDAIHRSLRDAHQPVIAGPTLPGDRRLDQVAGRVELVPPLEVGELPATLRHLEVGVQVAVVALCRGDEFHDGFGQADERRIGPLGDLPADRLEPLVDIGIEEGEGLPGVIATAGVAAFGGRCRVPRRGRQPKVPEVAGGLELGGSVRDRHVVVEALPVGPEAPRDPVAGQPDRPEASCRVMARDDGGDDPSARWSALSGAQRHDASPSGTPRHGA